MLPGERESAAPACQSSSSYGMQILREKMESIFPIARVREHMLSCLQGSLQCPVTARDNAPSEMLSLVGMARSVGATVPGQEDQLSLSGQVSSQSPSGESMALTSPPRGERRLPRPGEPDTTHSGLTSVRDSLLRGTNSTCVNWNDTTRRCCTPART